MTTKTRKTIIETAALVDELTDLREQIATLQAREETLKAQFRGYGVSAHIGTAVANTAFKNGLADRQQPEDVFADVQSQMYNPRYRSYV